MSVSRLSAFKAEDTGGGDTTTCTAAADWVVAGSTLSGNVPAAATNFAAGGARLIEGDVYGRWIAGLTICAKAVGPALREWLIL